jgi:hypothetical protein
MARGLPEMVLYYKQEKSTLRRAGQVGNMSYVECGTDLSARYLKYKDKEIVLVVSAAIPV